MSVVANHLKFSGCPEMVQTTTKSTLFSLVLITPARHYTVTTALLRHLLIGLQFPVTMENILAHKSSE